MHREAFRWTELFLKHHPEFNPAGKHVIEFGSYNVNGTIRPLFEDALSFVGVDVREGPDVDVVGDASTYGLDGMCNMVVSFEMLEHAPNPQSVIRNCWRILRPGGKFLLTCASDKRLPHNNDGVHGMPADEHYYGVPERELRYWLQQYFSACGVESNDRAGDLYAWAVR